MKKAAFLFLLFAEIAKGQSLTFQQPIAQVCPDKDGNFLVLLNNGSIKKYSPDGMLQASCKIKGITSLDASVASRIFYYKKKKKKIGWLTPGLEFLEEREVSDLNALAPGLACPASVREWWVTDLASPRGRRISMATDAVRVEFPLPENFDGKKMVYNNQYLFLCGRNSTLLYDFLGHFIKEFEGGDVNFLGEEFYFLQNHKLKFCNVYSSEEREIPVDSDCSSVIFLENKILELFPEKIIISSVKLPVRGRLKN